MEFVKFNFAFFTIALSLLCSDTTAYKPNRIRQELRLLREDISDLFDMTDQLNISANKACDRCMSDNKTSCPPVDGGKDIVMVNSTNVMVKYHSLIKAFVAEKKINRELQDQFQFLKDILSASEILANKRHRELEGRLQSMRHRISVSESVSNEKERNLQSRLRSVEDIISDIDKNMTLMAEARQQMNIERDRDLENRLQSMADRISASESVTNEKDRELQSRLQSMEDSIELTISDIYREFRNNMTSFMKTISDKIDDGLLTASNVITNCTTVPKSGVYTLYPNLIMEPVTVYCDQDTDGGGWIVFMRRQDGSVNFYRPWLDYKQGFGSPYDEFWAGNELLHKLTKERPLELRIDMEDFDGNKRFAKYEKFQIEDEKDKYRLHVSGYSGTAGDSLIDTDDSKFKHAGMQFTTLDSDNDNSKNNCAKSYKGAWWYNSCFDANLNAPYSQEKYISSWEGIIWYSWTGSETSLKHVEMKIR